MAATGDRPSGELGTTEGLGGGRAVDWIRHRLPAGWTSTARRRRWLFLGLAAPGFAAVFATPLHRSLSLLVAGGLMFAAAGLFRRRTEPAFLRADASAKPPALCPREAR